MRACVRAHEGGVGEWSEPYTPLLTFTEEELNIYNRYIVNLNAYQDEMITSFITGKADINAEWDRYVEQCIALGANEIVEITQAAYDRYLSNHKNENFYKIYFKFLVLYIYIINLDFTLVDLNNACHTYIQIGRKMSLFMQNFESYK